MPSPSGICSAILARHGMGLGDEIGRGEEARVYALGSDRVIKLFDPAIDPAILDRRESFHAALDASGLPFAVPQILKRGEQDGIRYTVEVRIPGSSLSQMLPHLGDATREKALLAYAETATQVARIGCPAQRIGEVMSVPQLVADDWASFVLARAGADLQRNRGRVLPTIDRPERALECLARWLAERPDAEPGLVHGDFYPANVMVDDAGSITGVIDFGGLTLYGDPRLDPACALLFLAGHDGVTVADRQIVSDHLRRRGLCDGDLQLYALFYAFRFLHTTREGLFRWCLDTLRAAC